jgi:ribosome recycling factor
MAYDFKHLKTKAKEAEEWLARELSGIRTGRATPAVLDNVQVESYGSRMQIREVAAVSLEDARSLRISPWDASQSKDIATAITSAGLGLSVAVDDRGVRVSFPELTSERRTTLLKLAKEKLEEGKKHIRVLRDEIWKDIQAKEKEGGMSEDEKFRLKNEMEKLIADSVKNLDANFAKKEKEISE